MRLLVTRPLPAGAATAERLRALGHDVTLAPLMATEAMAWTSGAYDLELVSPGGVVTALLEGAVQVSSEITTPII